MRPTGVLVRVRSSAACGGLRGGLRGDFILRDLGDSPCLCLLLEGEEGLCGSISFLIIIILICYSFHRSIDERRTDR